MFLFTRGSSFKVNIGLYKCMYFILQLSHSLYPQRTFGNDQAVQNLLLHVYKYSNIRISQMSLSRITVNTLFAKNETLI